MTSTIQDRFNIVPEEGVKAPCLMATTANVTLSGLQTIDTIVGVEDDRVLVKNQTDASENGIYAMKPTAWIRTSDWDDNTDLLSGMLISNTTGGQSNEVFQATFVGTFSIDTTEVFFVSISASGITEAPVDGSSYIRRNAGWTTLADAPDAVEEAPEDGKEYIRKDAGWSILDIGANLTIDSAQTGILVKNTYWAVAATAARTRALPASPANGDEVTIFIASGDARANNVTIGRNGNNIDAIAADKVLTISCIQKLKFDSAGSNWVSVLDTNRTLDGRINHWREVVRTLTDAFIDANLGTWQKRTLAGNETLTFDLHAGQSVYLTVVPGANTLTLTNVTEWVGGAAPGTVEAEHAFLFWSDDGIAVTGMSVGGIS